MNKIDYKEYAKQMRENCAKDYYGNIICSAELWEEIAKMIDDVAPIQKMLWELKEAIIWHNWKRAKKIIKYLEGDCKYERSGDLQPSSRRPR